MLKVRAVGTALGLLVPSCAVYEDQSHGPPLGGISAGSGQSGAAGSTAEPTAGQPTTSGGSSGTSSVAGGETAGTGDITRGGATNTGGTGAAGGRGGTAGRGGTGGATGGAAGDSSAGGKGGNAGTAGSIAMAGMAGSTGMQSLCSDHALPAKGAWRATASSYFTGNTPELPSLGIDGDVATRWSSGVPQAGKDWVQVDFGKAATLDQVTLVLGKSVTDSPIAYEARVSDKSGDFAAPVLAQGSGTAGGDTVIHLQNKATGRYLLISQTGSGASWWSIAEVDVSCKP